MVGEIMDPKETWRDAVEAAKRSFAGYDGDECEHAMAEAITLLDEWIRRGGFCPFCAGGAAAK